MENKNGNITIKTRKELAEEVGVSQKTYREYLKYINCLDLIDSNIGPEKAKAFSEIIEDLEKNKKKNISTQQIMALSKMPAEMQIAIVDKIIKHPQNAKQIILNFVPCETKVTVTLPSWVNEWYMDQAEELGISKTKFIEETLIDICEHNYSD